MFRQKQPFPEWIDGRPFAGVIQFLAMGILLWIGQVGWPLAAYQADALRWEWFALLWVTYFVRYFILRGRQRGWFLGLFALSLAFFGIAAWRSIDPAGTWVGWIRSALVVLLPSVLVAYAGEAVVAVWHHLFINACPYGCRLNTFSGRRAIGDLASSESGKLAITVALYGILGLLSLHRNYVFDMFAYSYVLAVTVLLTYVFTAGGAAARLWRGISAELAHLEDGLEGSYERFLRPGAQAQDFSAQFRLNLAMQDRLRDSGRLPMRWESFLLLVAAMILTLLPPYIVCILNGISG